MNPNDPPHVDDYYVSFDKDKLDYSFVVREIQNSYWGAWRSPTIIFKSIDNSICLGLYYHSSQPNKDLQVGFARVVTDHCTFAWICDVVVTEAHRHKGLGKFIMSSLMAHPEVAPRACMLATRDAHELYRKFGFSEFTAMKRLPAKNKE